MESQTYSYWSIKYTPWSAKHTATGQSNTPRGVPNILLLVNQITPRGSAKHTATGQSNTPYRSLKQSLILVISLIHLIKQDP